ncbi:winged helix-turn-helix domain-containing protein [Budvicia diplopodorum]|uniref:winged helix-turn-helix domain-containing protein n=1 Tax=Budvicia diplopodorum TaxID=1119056 RepID=UPI00135AC285|nr:winged helix-turn-helix domain-containing protein [Budvicia diplopodorum]
MNSRSCKYCVINNEIAYFPEENKLASLDIIEQKIAINAPASRCFQLLLEKRGQVVSRNEFLEVVWKSNGAYVSLNTFYQNISLLRKSLKKVGPNQDIIITVRRKGFALAPNTIVEQVTEPKTNVYSRTTVLEPRKYELSAMKKMVKMNVKLREICLNIKYLLIVFGMSLLVIIQMSLLYLILAL